MMRGSGFINRRFSLERRCLLASYHALRPLSAEQPPGPQPCRNLPCLLPQSTGVPESGWSRAGASTPFGGFPRAEPRLVLLGVTARESDCRADTHGRRRDVDSWQALYDTKPCWHGCSLHVVRVAEEAPRKKREMGCCP